MDPADLIRASGLRVTRQRAAVLAAVDAVPHASASAVLDAVAAMLPDVSHQAVYDCLTDLTAAGLLRRIVVNGGPARYETRTLDNHHHFVCRICGSISDVDCAVGTAPCLDAAGLNGFVIDEAEVVYRGRCVQCAASDEPVQPPEQLEISHG